MVSARTGIPQDLLRAWEKRYGAVAPRRGPTGRRLYTDDDIQKLRLLKLAVSGGRRISDVASLSVEELTQITAEDRSQAAPPPPRDRAGNLDGDYVSLALEALEQLDKARLDRVLADAAVELSAPALRRQVIVPLLNTIGDRWQEGTLRIVHEHLASSIVRAFVEGRRGGSVPQGVPKMLVTTPSGQRHELGALLAAIAAEEYGWDVVYLGPDLPAEEIAAATRQLEPRAIGLSVVYKTGNLQVLEEIQKLRRYVSDDIGIFVGGRAVSALKPTLERIGVTCVEDLAVFQNELILASDKPS